MNTATAAPQLHTTGSGLAGPTIGIVRRDLIALRRRPALVLANLAAPLGLVLVFGYVFGGALAGSGSTQAYREALVPAVFILVAGTSLVVTAGTAAAEVSTGVTDRLRTMPISRLAMPLGLSISQLFLSVVSFGLMALVGLLVGWRTHTGSAHVLAGFGLLFLFAYALTWLGITLGLLVANRDIIAQLAPLIIGFVMLSNALVPTSSMPGPVRWFAEWNPFSAAVTAVRSLFGNGATAGGPWPLTQPVAATLSWTALILFVCAPIAMRAYGRQD